MTERPILMSGPMVRACLRDDDPKTQTRRVMQRPPLRTEPHDEPNVILYQRDGTPLKTWYIFDEETTALLEHVRPDVGRKPTKAALRRTLKWQRNSYSRHPFKWSIDEVVGLSPYGVPGDRLWVRETWQPSWRTDHGHGVKYRADDAIRCFNGCCNDLRIVEPGYHELAERYPSWNGRWTPAIHMPRWACRLVLEVTSVRVERLLEIGVEDCFAEGIEPMRCPQCHLACYGLPGWGHDDVQKTPIEAYWHLWDQLNEARGYGRAKNPWVWVVSFKQWEER